MSLYTLSNAEALPLIHQPGGLVIQESTDAKLLSVLGNTSEDDVTKRLATDHLAFVAYVHQQPAAFGWMARGKATIGELNHSFVLPLRNRYLWNFRTLEEYRGLGIYPALLQHIVHSEGRKASRYWIIHAPENTSSLKGITKAGFHYVGKLYTKADGSVALEAGTKAEAHRRTLEDMDIRLSTETGASCWNCSSPYLKKRKQKCCCETVSKACIGNRTLSIAS